MEPISAFYNEFFNMICVLCGNQLKLFNAEQGRLTVLHQNLFKMPNSLAYKIDLDKRHRKIYVASSNGQIQVMNVESGVILKQVIDEPEEDEKVESKALPFSEKRKPAEEEDEKTFLTQVRAQAKPKTSTDKN